jgi:hypothetical protein
MEIVLSLNNCHQQTKIFIALKQMEQFAFHVLLDFTLIKVEFASKQILCVKLSIK